MNWLEIYRPKLLSEIKLNRLEIDKAINWITNYKKNSVICDTPKVLFIIGPTGIGKTLLADLILKNYNYQKIELNSTDVRSQKKIGEFLKKSLTYRNIVDMFNEGNKPIGILMDEIDTLCKLSDKGGFTEFLTILKQNEKFHTLKKNIADKKKMKKTKTKILVDDYIELYNPIICTANDVTDKKITELKKYSEVINLQKPSHEEMVIIIDDLYKKNNQTITEDVKLDISIYSQYDIRRLIIILEDLHYFSNGKIIDKILFEKFKKTYDEKYEEIQLLDSTKILITKKLDILDSSRYFDVDCLLTPLMLYHNSIDFIKGTEDTPKKKLNIYKNILNSLCIHDTIQTNIFEVQDWDELYNVASIYGSSIPNYYFNELKNNKPVNIEFTSLLNKISQMFVNKKLLNSANFSIGNINIDTDELIYLTEIISVYFDKYKEEALKDDENDDEDEINEENNISDFKKPLENNNELIKLMNKYSMNIDSLENILKIEKLNKINEKRKKKFTLKIKKDISNYLIAK
jgi:SpoVK/Ycf46/Vps4 family AAA+-type ATPase